MLVTEIIEQEYENPFGIHFDKEKLVNFISGRALDDIAESIHGSCIQVYMIDVGKSRMEDFRQ